MDYIKEAEEELKAYNDLSNALSSISEEMEIIECELKSVKSMAYDNIPGGSKPTGDERLVNLIYKKQIKEDVYKLTQAKVKHIQNILVALEDTGDENNIDSELLRQLYLERNNISSICLNLNISERTFHRRKFIALRRFARQLFGIKVD